MLTFLPTPYFRNIYQSFIEQLLWIGSYDRNKSTVETKGDHRRLRHWMLPSLQPSLLLTSTTGHYKLSLCSSRIHIHPLTPLP